MNETAGGITTESRLRALHAPSSIRFNRESDSNAIDESDRQYQKHDEQRISTFRGITTDASDDHENAFDSIRVNRESDSNVIDESD
jgi:hypothetical protein